MGQNRRTTKRITNGNEGILALVIPLPIFRFQHGPQRISDLSKVLDKLPVKTGEVHKSRQLFFIGNRSHRSNRTNIFPRWTDTISRHLKSKKLNFRQKKFTLLQ